jgi:hypothetical protein
MVWFLGTRGVATGYDIGSNTISYYGSSLTHTQILIVRACGRGRLGTCGIVGMTTGRLAPLTLCRVKQKKRKLGIVWFGLGLVPPHAKLILL